MVRYLVQEMGASINHPVKYSADTEIEGSVLALAIEKLDLMKLLCQELGANVNEPISLAGKPTNILNLEIQNIKRQIFILNLKNQNNF